jgi:hypothetical protein
MAELIGVRRVQNSAALRLDHDGRIARILNRCRGGIGMAGLRDVGAVGRAGLAAGEEKGGGKENNF